MGGIGKSALAHAIYIRHFQDFSSRHACVTLDHGSDIATVQENLLGQLCGDFAKVLSIHNGQQRITDGIRSFAAPVMPSDAVQI